MNADQKLQYIKDKGSKCPYCGYDDLYSQEIHFEGDSFISYTECLRCGKRWKDVYGIIDVDEERLNMTHWEIIDDAGIIESGDEEEVKEAWEKMLIGEYEMGKNVVPFTGRVRLVQVWGEI